MITVLKAKKILGQLVASKTDDEIRKELDMAVFISEIILDAFKQSYKYDKLKLNKHG